MAGRILTYSEKRYLDPSAFRRFENDLFPALVADRYADL